MQSDKQAVREFWNAQACGEVYFKGSEPCEQFEAQSHARFELEPFIIEFARFHEGAGQRVLEVGVGMGADHIEWARSMPSCLAGVDLTERAVSLTRERLHIYGARSCLYVADAERLPFADESFDIVYSWGVLHHSPDTPRAIAEVYRVLRPGGRAAIMVYHRASIVGFLLWLRYGLRRGLTLDQVYASRLESPGTKAYSRAEVRRLFERYSSVEIATRLSAGDLMSGAAGQRHGGPALRIARRIWPRRLVRRLGEGNGLFLLISAEK